MMNGTFAHTLLEWYDANRRELPWRGETDPYRIWLSEVMLQQTRTETVERYYRAFLARFPRVQDLAAADEGEVLKLWEGMGYYSRARNLHKAAKMVAFEMKGIFPRTAKDLRALPGIGPYASGAIASIAIITILYWFFGTELGSAIRATGNNPNMVRAQGINTDTMKILGLVISNGLVAMSGAMIGQSQAFADIQMGIGSIVIGLASLIIGEVLFSKKNFYMRLLALIFGAVVYRVIIALVLKAGMPTNDLKLFTAITVAFALSLPRIKSYFLGLKKKVRKEAH